MHGTFLEPAFQGATPENLRSEEKKGREEKREKRGEQSRGKERKGQQKTCALQCLSHEIHNIFLKIISRNNLIILNSEAKGKRSVRIKQI